MSQISFVEFGKNDSAYTRLLMNNNKSTPLPINVMIEDIQALPALALITTSEGKFWLFAYQNCCYSCYLDFLKCAKNFGTEMVIEYLVLDTQERAIIKMSPKMI